METQLGTGECARFCWMGLQHTHKYARTHTHTHKQIIHFHYPLRQSTLVSGDLGVMLLLHTPLCLTPLSRSPQAVYWELYPAESVSAPLPPALSALFESQSQTSMDIYSQSETMAAAPAPPRATQPHTDRPLCCKCQHHSLLKPTQGVRKAARQCLRQCLWRISDLCTACRHIYQKCLPARGELIFWGLFFFASVGRRTEVELSLN